MNPVQVRNQRRVMKATLFTNLAVSVLVTGFIAPAFALVLGMAPEGLVSKMYDRDASILLYYCLIVFAVTWFLYFIGSLQLRNYE